MQSLDAQAQLQEWEAHLNGPPPIPTGMFELDELLYRGGLAPGTLVLFGGRTRTRKTTVTLNLITRMLSAGIPVGLVGLDEARHSYIGKLMSAYTGYGLPQLEDMYNDGRVAEVYKNLSSNLVMYEGYRPSTGDLSEWLLESEVKFGLRPQVVFIDYLSLLTRDKYAGAEVQRVSRLVEDLQVWTKEKSLITIALHQVGRLDEGVGLRYHGDTPMSLEGLKYGGEEIADIVLATYRPALDPLGNMKYDMAAQYLGGMDEKNEEKWEQAKLRVDKYREHTFLQLIKNRPGTHTNEQGIPLKSVGESMRMDVDTDIVAADNLELLQAFGS